MACMVGRQVLHAATQRNKIPPNHSRHRALIPSHLFPHGRKLFFGAFEACWALHLVLYLDHMAHPATSLAHHFDAHISLQAKDMLKGGIMC